MTPADAAKLLALAAAFDRRTVGESDAMAWADALDGLRLEDCIQAVKDHYRASDKWVMPSNVREGVRLIRRARLERDPEALPDADPNDVPAYLAALREGRFRAADGEEFRPDAANLIRGAIRDLPKDVS